MTRKTLRPAPAKKTNLASPRIVPPHKQHGAFAPRLNQRVPGKGALVNRTQPPPESREQSIPETVSSSSATQQLRSDYFHWQWSESLWQERVGFGRTQTSPRSPERPIPRQSMRDCVVCAERKQALEFPKRVTAKCKHLPYICVKDLQLWVASELERKGWDKISCPECNEILQHEDVKANASKMIFDR